MTVFERSIDVVLEVLKLFVWLMFGVVAWFILFAYASIVGGYHVFKNLIR